jgi:hypothetical protein
MICYRGDTPLAIEYGDLICFRLMALFTVFDANQQTTKMTANNLAVCIAPTYVIVCQNIV